MKYQRSIPLSLLAALCPAVSLGATIQGTVSDPQGAPVIGAKVEVAGKALSTWSGAGGRYRLDAAALEAGRYTVRALSEDFEIAVAEAQVPASGEVIVNLRFRQVRKAVTSIEVIGDPVQALREIPGSAFLVSREELAASNPMDANEVLRRVPGLVLREDSGPVALRLSVGIRGLNPDRSRRVLMLEDGIPISLAPYGEPEMYYSPPVDRMKKIEVLKGSGQILYGPQTVGGVVNFVTPDPPLSTHGEIDLAAGQRGFFTGQGQVGGSNRDQSAGYVFNFLHKQGDGFRHFYFDLDDVQLKATMKPGERNTFAFKLGAYDEKSNSTYLGLTTPMFTADPSQNPVPSDLMRVRRMAGSLFHTYTVNPNTVVDSAAFAYNTVRNWRRQEFERADSRKNYLGVAGDPSVAGGAIYLLDQSANRDRQFSVLGVQSSVSHQHSLFGRRNKLDSGLRYVYEETDDKFVIGDRLDSSTGMLRDDEDRFGKAFSVFAQNRIFLSKRLILTPGLRMEDYRYVRHIQRKPVATAAGTVPRDVDIRAQRRTTAWIPGAGVSYQASEAITLFGGLHRGYAPPVTKNAITSVGEAYELDAELSWNYEAGIRLDARRALQAEFTYFRIDFENQIIQASPSGGATTALVNAGETLNEGIESSLRVNWERVVRSPFIAYSEVRHTYLPKADFTRHVLYNNMRLPYAPRNSFSIILGIREFRGFGFQVDGNYLGNQFADNRATVKPSADGTIGLIPERWVWNSGCDYTIRKEKLQLVPYFAIKNAANRIYIASRAPAGAQPGLFRQVNAGLRFVF